MKACQEIVEFIAARGTREVVDFKPSPATQQRVPDLIDREKNSALSAEERAEPDDYGHLELLMNLAKGARANCLRMAAGVSAVSRR